MSNQHNEKAFEKIMQEVEELDKQGKLESEIQTICETYRLHEDDDRDDILFFIAESNFHYDTV